MRDGPEVAKGRAIAAFAISDDHAGSDMAAMQTTAVRDGGDWVLDGRKTWISNAGIAHFSDARDRRLGAA
jgi:acyl-CoA dehydrogenase